MSNWLQAPELGYVLRRRDATVGWYANIFAMAVAMTFVRLLRIPFHELWRDETTTLGFVQSLSYPELVTYLPVTQPHFPVYYLLLKGWLELVGPGQFEAATLSAIFGGVSIVAIAALGRIWFNPRVGATAALLLAFNPMHFYWSVNIRMYTLLLFLTIASFLLLTRVARHTTRLNLLAYILLLIILGYTHYFAWFVIAVHVAALYGLHAVEYREHALKAAVAVVASSIPAMVMILGKLYNVFGARQFGNANQMHEPEQALSLVDIVRVWVHMGVGWINNLDIGEWSIAILLIGGAAFGCYKLWNRSRYYLPVLTLTATVAVLFIGTYILLNLTGWGVNANRYFISALPALILFFAVGVDSIENRVVHSVLVALIIANLSVTEWIFSFLNWAVLIP